MPVLPALFRHIRHIRQQRSELRGSKSHSQGWRGDLGGRTLGASKGGSNESYPLSREYRELDTLTASSSTIIQTSSCSATASSKVRRKDGYHVALCCSSSISPRSLFAAPNSEVGWCSRSSLLSIGSGLACRVDSLFSERAIWMVFR